MAATFDLNDSEVVVIVGSGAGGGTLANELAQKGVNKIVILEAGKQFTLEDIENDEWAMFSKLSWLDKRVTAGTWSPHRTAPNLPAWICKTVGGSTVHWTGVSLRFQPHEFKPLTTYGRVLDANLIDWPLSYEDMVPYYELAEKKMGVSGAPASGMPELPKSNNTLVAEAGARKIGYKNVVHRMAINSRPYDGRPGCQQIGFCVQGCKIGAKWSTLYTEIPRAIATGRVELRPEAMVLQIQHDKSGKVNGVLYADKNGTKHLQKARIVCVAGNSIESPRLLLNSASSKFTDGLANSSGQVGRNYMAHATAAAFAIHQKPVKMHRGTAVAAIVMDEQKHDPSRGFVAGYNLIVLSQGLPFAAAFLRTPNGWGREMTSVLDKYDHMSGVWICGEQMPMEQNGVTLHPTEKDQHGLPVPIVANSDHANDALIVKHALGQWRKMNDALGSNRIVEVPVWPAAHNLGTNRMSAKASDGVVNKWGQAHDVKNLFISDGSQFASSAVANPTLTIVALAIRQAEYIVDQMKRKQL
ncbi:GMC family oxidoreductase [Aromatoleum diolicum]|uniref:GMC family oxidoreductase n=1 Tax=Aromatoleum diolicum TaxID=75796 RepID=A0ABX1Q7Z6_9RHOO|nr:GMC family oxidoreductase [Aromatoleum diolicum]NMG74190.1 GMC family oxidoreductase [Aromatoleum diolicum]